MRNIENGLCHYKTFGGNVTWDPLHPENLILARERNLDLSFYKQFPQQLK